MNFSGSNYYVRILSTIDRELLKPSASVALHKHSNALVDVLPPEADSSITMLQAGKTLIYYRLSLLHVLVYVFWLDSNIYLCDLINQMIKRLILQLFVALY